MAKRRPTPAVLMDLTIVEDAKRVRLGVVARADEVATRTAFAVLSASAVPAERADARTGVVFLRAAAHGVEARVAVPWPALLNEIARASWRRVDEAVFRRVSAACRTAPSVSEASAGFLLDADGPIALLGEALAGDGASAIAESHVMPSLALLRAHVTALRSGGTLVESDRRRLVFLLGDLAGKKRRPTLTPRDRLVREALTQVYHGRALDASALVLALVGPGASAQRLLRALAAHRVEGHERVVAAMTKAMTRG